MHSKSFLNKLSAFLEKKREEYMNNMRNSRLLKKDEGISEFFKNLSQIEKGNGEIHDVVRPSSQNEEEKVS